MAANVDRIINGYEEAQQAANYGEALVLDEEEISGDDYRLLLTNAYTGAYPRTEK